MRRISRGAQIKAENEEQVSRDMQDVAYEAATNPPETVAAAQLASWSPVQRALGEGLREQAVLSGSVMLSPSVCARMHRRDKGVRFVPPEVLQVVAQFFKDD